MYKNNCSILGLTKGRCKFTTSVFLRKILARKPTTILILNRCKAFENQLTNEIKTEFYCVNFNLNI
jgi:hypothetical protein